MEVCSILERVVRTSLDDADLDVCRAGLADAAAVERWLTAWRVACHARV